MIRRLLLAASVASSLCGSAGAQLFPLSADINARPLQNGVSIPTIAPTDTVYPGCPAPPLTLGNVWNFDPSGQTQAAYTTAGVSMNPLVTPHQGDATHPWNNFQAAFTSQSGYTTTLLSTVHGSTGPIQPGDKVLLNSGNYGAIGIGGLSVATSEVVNNPALTIAAAPGQTPVLTELSMASTTGLVWNGVKVQSLNTDGLPLIFVQDGGIAGFTSSNIVFENMDVSSAPVSTSDTWTRIQWQANARRGIVIEADGPGGGMNCISVVNSHVYVTYGHNDAAIDALGSNALVQNNQIDHFSTAAIAYNSSNVAILGNVITDAVDANPSFGDQYIAIANTGVSTVSLQSNVEIAHNKAIESIDPSQAFQGLLNGITNFNGDITNIAWYDNLIAGNGGSLIDVGNAHNGIVCNNSLMASGTGGGQLYVLQAHGGSTGPEGNPPSNIRICNNIAPIIAYYYGVNVQADHNIATNTVGNPWNYQSGWSLIFVNATPGAFTTLSATDTGPSNFLDGFGATHEYTAVPTAGSFPMSPQPNWTPKSGSPAKIFGGAVLIPPITDFNGAAFAPPYSFGALN